jgi:hypothetical protein
MTYRNIVLNDVYSVSMWFNVLLWRHQVKYEHVQAMWMPTNSGLIWFMVLPLLSSSFRKNDLDHTNTLSFLDIWYKGLLMNNRCFENLTNKMENKKYHTIRRAKICNR